MEQYKKGIKYLRIAIVITYFLMFPVFILCEYRGFSGLHSTIITLIIQVIIVYSLLFIKLMMYRKFMKRIISILQDECDAGLYIMQIESYLAAKERPIRAELNWNFLLGVGYYHGDQDDRALDLMKTVRYTKKAMALYRLYAMSYMAYIFLHKNECEKVELILQDIEQAKKKVFTLKLFKSARKSLDDSIQRIRDKLSYQTGLMSQREYSRLLFEQENLAKSNLDKVVFLHSKMKMLQQLERFDESSECARELSKIDGTLPRIREACEVVEENGGAFL